MLSWRQDYSLTRSARSFLQKKVRSGSAYLYLAIEPPNAWTRILEDDSRMHVFTRDEVSKQHGSRL